MSFQRGQYASLPNDGAGWRCRECKEVFDNHEVILFFNSATKKKEILCVKYVDTEWFMEAVCVGEAELK